METLFMVDFPSLIMALSFTSNLVVGFFDPIEIPVSKEMGVILLISGFLLLTYVLFYLRSGFLGETAPKLDTLLRKGPYRFCRHPQYLSFIIIVLGYDLMFRSVVGVVFTLLLSLPSAVYRAKVGDVRLREKFGREWETYAKEVGFLIPVFKR